MIIFNHVSKFYNHGTVAIDDVSLHIKTNEFISIVGRSGAGKSTVVKLLIGEIKPDRGELYVDRERIDTFTPLDLPRYRRKVGIVFQDFKLLESKTAFENIAFAMEVAGLETRRINEDVPRILKIIGLSDRANNFPHELSGGEKQRIAIGRALALRPKILVADEPTGNLDPIHTWDIINLMVRINELGTTVILASHDKEIINSLGKRVVSLEKGRLIRDEQQGKYIL